MGYCLSINCMLDLCFSSLEEKEEEEEEEPTRNMKLASLLVAVILSAVVLLATSATVREPGSAPIPGNHGRRLGAGPAMEDPASAMTSEGQKGEEDGMFPLDESKFGEKNYKICLIPGPCYKKKLVCPKQCSNGGGIARIQPSHFPGASCVLDCKKCTARC